MRIVAAVVLLCLSSANSALLRAPKKPAAAAPEQNLTAEVDGLHGDLTAFLRDHKDGAHSGDDHNFGQNFMTASQKVLQELTEGKKTTEKIQLAEKLIADLKMWAAHTTGRMSEIKHKMSEDDANWLMKLLVERQHLPMATQLAVLKRKDVAELPWAQRLLKDHKDSGPCLADQFRAILATEAKDVKMKVGHRIAIDRTKQGDKLREVQKKVGEMQGQIKDLVAEMETAFQKDPTLSKDPKARALLDDAHATVKRMETDILKKKLKDMSEVGHDLKSLENLEKDRKAKA